jgi:hypothetical protein
MGVKEKIDQADVIVKIRRQNRFRLWYSQQSLSF